MESLKFKARNGYGDGDGPLQKSTEISIMVNNIRNTIFTLEKSFCVMHNLEAQQRTKIDIVKNRNYKLDRDLKAAEQRNYTMLNLFRLNTDELPDNLQNQVKRAWQQKYDAILELNDQLQKETYIKNVALKEKDKQIAVLQEKLLNIGEKLIQRDTTMKSICNKYLSLKKRKDQQEILLRGSIETLQDALLKTNSTLTSTMSRMSLMPSKEALVAYETRRSDRLARENCLLRALLRETQNNCQCNHSPEASSCNSICQ